VSDVADRARATAARGVVVVAERVLSGAERSDNRIAETAPRLKKVEAGIDFVGVERGISVAYVGRRGLEVVAHRLKLREGRERHRIRWRRADDRRECRSAVLQRGQPGAIRERSVAARRIG